MLPSNNHTGTPAPVVHRRTRTRAALAIVIGVTLSIVTASNAGAEAQRERIAAGSPQVVTVNDKAGSSGVSVTYSGSWQTSTGNGKYQGDDHYSDSSGATVTLGFTGTAITLYGAKAAWHGIAAVSIDGGPETMADAYSASRVDQTSLFSVSGLTSAPHRVTLRVTGSRRGASSGGVVSFDRAQVTVSPAPAATATPSSPPTATGPYVTRSGNKLMLNGSVFRFTGANLYWLGLDDNITDSGQPTYPTRARIDNGLRAARDAGFTVIRATTLGISVGCPRCFAPSLGSFNQAALQSADYALYRAGQLGIRVMIPLVDQWRWYHGGISTFTVAPP